jgi:hypothetical protein
MPQHNLPTHPRLQLVGIHDMDRRLRFDAKDPLTMDTYNDTPFFPLVEQMTLLIHKDAFPCSALARLLMITKSDCHQFVGPVGSSTKCCILI